MARQMDDDEEVRFREERTRYPWTDWTNGKQWEAIAGEDFTCSSASFVSYLHDYAKRNGFKVRTRTFRDPVRVVFKFDKMKPPDRRFKRKRV